MSKPVLVVDDDDDLRSNISDVLESEGYTVLLAANGQEALELLVAHFGKNSFPGCVLLDLMMPVMNGKEFLKTLTENYPQIFDELNIFIWTAKLLDFESLPSFTKEIGTLEKPLEISELLRVVEKCCGKKGHVGGP